MAFQVVLLVGSVDVVVPENVAVAVNYACVECVTQALATQLVVTLPGRLSQAGTDELATIWAELQTFGEQLDGLPLSELRDRLTDYEVRILDVVQRDGAVDEDGDTAGDDLDRRRRGVSRARHRTATATDAADGAGGDDAVGPTGSAGPTATSARPDGATSDDDRLHRTARPRRRRPRRRRPRPTPGPERRPPRRRPRPAEAGPRQSRGGDVRGSAGYGRLPRPPTSLEPPP